MIGPMGISEVLGNELKEKGEALSFKTKLEDVKLPDVDALRKSGHGLEFSKKPLDIPDFKTKLEDVRLPDVDALRSSGPYKGPIPPFGKVEGSEPPLERTGGPEMKRIPYPLPDGTDGPKPTPPEPSGRLPGDGRSWPDPLMEERRHDLRNGEGKISDQLDGQSNPEAKPDAGDGTGTLRELTEDERQELRDKTNLSENALDNIQVDEDGNYILRTRNCERKGQEYPPGSGVMYVEKVVDLGNGIKIKGVFPEFPHFFKATVPQDLWNEGDNAIFKNCTEQLRDYLEKHPEMKKQFTPEQLAQIEAGSPRISGYVWHHTEKPGEVQFVKSNDHENSRHTGGNSVWCNGVRQ